MRLYILEYDSNFEGCIAEYEKALSKLFEYNFNKPLDILSVKNDQNEQAQKLITHIKNHFVESVNSVVLFDKINIDDLNTYLKKGDMCEDEESEDSESTVILIMNVEESRELLYNLTQIAIDHKKARIIALSYNKNEDKFNLDFALPLHKRKRLLKSYDYKSACLNVRDEMISYLNEGIEDILKAREKYILDSFDIESVHKMRVKIRSFRSFLNFIKDFYKKKDFAKIQNFFRNKGNELAYLRELDVIMEEWESLIKKGVFKEIESKGEEFKLILSRERENERVRLLNSLSRPNFRIDLEKIKALMIKKIKVRKINGDNLKGIIKRKVVYKLEDTDQRKNTVSLNSHDEIHSLRINAKKIRYNMERFNLNEDSVLEEKYKSMKKWQESIGMICDANRNQNAVFEILNKYHNPTALEEVNIFIEYQRKTFGELTKEFFNRS